MNHPGDPVMKIAAGLFLVSGIMAMLYALLTIGWRVPRMVLVQGVVMALSLLVAGCVDALGIMYLTAR
jgi:hypothetical protein